MLLVNCDVTSALEDGGLGAIIVAIIWMVKYFFFGGRSGPTDAGIARKG